MKYPDYLSIGNWLFQHLKIDESESRPVGGYIPDNLYISLSRWRAINLSKDLRTYQGLIANGATEPDDKELLRLLK